MESCLEDIGCEDTGADCVPVGNNEAEVVSAFLFESCLGCTSGKAERKIK